MRAHELEWKTLETVDTSESIPHVLFIRFNRTESFNSINHIGYNELLTLLRKAQHDIEIRAVVFTGKGHYYSSGQDLRSLSRDSSSDMPISKTLWQQLEITRDFVRALIDFEKILIAAVNGPALGVMVTTMTLFDFIYAARSATFTTPFTRLGFCPEGCSSILFPLLMGYSKANRLLVRRHVRDPPIPNCFLIDLY
jgi:Delta3-Delta2-enoyl-CoA isomerase